MSKVDLGAALVTGASSGIGQATAKARRLQRVRDQSQSGTGNFRQYHDADLRRD